MAKRPKPRSISDALSRFDGDDRWGLDNDAGGGSWVRGASCYASHPPLVLPGNLTIHGGSCFTPAVKDADIYIGFDGAMSATTRAYPWNPGHEIRFPITDMQAPRDAGEFRSLVEWTLTQLQAGQRVHCGCIGGHGRTGTFLAALAASCGVEDPIKFVRANYCKRAVESREQVRFLCEEYGAKPSDGAKAGLSISARATAGFKTAKTRFDPDLWPGNGRAAAAGVTRKAPDGRTQILYDPFSDKLIF